MLQIQLFGTLQATRDGTPFALPLRRDTQRLWVFLLLHRDLALDREHVAYSLWPDDPHAVALARLRRNLSFLASHLPAATSDAAWVLRDRRVVQWNPEASFRLDVDGFERQLRSARAQLASGNRYAAIDDLERAVEHYRGPLVCDLEADWVVAFRDRLHAAFLDALRQVSALLADEGHLVEAIAAANRLLSFDPLHEATHRDLMGWYVRSGDRAAALQQFRRCADILQRELAVEPDPDTIALHEGIRNPTGRSVAATATDAGDGDSSHVFSMGQLPASPGRFIGRAHEIDQVRRLLGSTRLLTLSGAGGSGKTRLALHLAETVRDRFPDGVWWVGLDRLTDPPSVATEIARAFGFKTGGSQSAIEVLAANLRHSQCLLVLDNCEHVIDAVAEIASTLLEACPQAQLLTTSREAIAVAGEQRYHVPPMALEAGGPTDPSEAAQLFLHCVGSYWPGYEATPARLAAIDDICRQVDGLPLAIELAASQLRVLPVEAVADRLQAGMAGLADHRRTEVARHRTLDAAVAWSYALLSDAERCLLRRLTVFQGGFTLEAALAVCCFESAAPNSTPLSLEILDLLGRLIDKSLVVLDADPPGKHRYRMLQVIRQNCAARLGKHEREALDRHFVAYFVELAAARYGINEIDEWVRWQDRCEAEYDNLCAVMRKIQAAGDSATGLHLAETLKPFWFDREHFEYERTWLQDILSHVDAAQPDEVVDRLWIILAAQWATAGRFAEAIELAHACAERGRSRQDLDVLARSLILISQIESASGHLMDAHAAGEEGLALARQVEEVETIAKALNGLSTINFQLGRIDVAEACRREALDLCEGEVVLSTLRIWLLQSLAQQAQYVGDYAQAYALNEAASSSAEKLKHVYAQHACLTTLGYLFLDRGNFAEAIQRFKQALVLSRRLARVEESAFDLHNLGIAHFRQGDLATARFYLERSLELKRREPIIPWSTCYTLAELADLNLACESLEIARTYADEAYVTARDLGVIDLRVRSARVLAKVEIAEGHLETSADLLAESLRLAAGQPNRRFLARTLDACATLALARGDPTGAARLCGAADGLWHAAEGPRAHGEAQEQARCVTAARAALGEWAAEEALRAGRARPIDGVIADALVMLA